jgi:histidinol-phosphate/aromatic aminotransferase/cobyric acid decarboxylase-like protein
MQSPREDPAPSLEFGSEPRVHGGLHDAELEALGVDAEQLLDFSASTNPYGPAPNMLRALREAPIARYPDASGRRARQALGACLGVAADELVLGNGAADLLWSLARAWLTPGQRALMVEPTFSEFGTAARARGAELCEWRSRIETSFAVDLPAVGELARSAGATVVYLCSPNTPTGSAVPIAAVQAFASEHPRLRIVLDQSFLSLSELHADAALRLPSNVACVRSLTKDHGIPGVRVGYLIASAELCRAIEAGRPAWTTSAFAQAATIQSCEAGEFVRDSRERLLGDRRALAHDLAELGIASCPSRTTFLLARVPGVAELRARLITRHRIVVRDCASFGLPGFMRLGARPAAARQRLIEALRIEAPGLARGRSGEGSP